MSDRKVAYIAEIENIADIPNKDDIKKITLKNLGWNIVANVKKSNINIGDKVVYIEYDTIIKPVPCLEWLKERCYQKKYNGCRIRAMSIGSTISYGIIFTLDEAKQIAIEYAKEYNNKDVSNDATFNAIFDNYIDESREES